MPESEPPPSSSTPATKTRTFKPRTGIVRKSKAERDAYAKEEADKAAARAAVAQAAERPVSNTKSGSTKKRESVRDRQNNQDDNTNIASGVLGAAVGAKPERGRRVVDEGYSERLGGQEPGIPADQPVLSSQNAAKTVRGNLGGQKASAVGDGKRPGPSDDEMTIEREQDVIGPRRNIEDIELSSDEEGLEMTMDTRKGKGRATRIEERPQSRIVLRPVRAPRYKRHSQGTEDSSEGESGDKRRRRLEMDGREDEDLQNGNETASRDPQSSPELSKKTKPSKRPASKQKDNKLSTETIEEKAERNRLDKDVEKLLQEFTEINRAEVTDVNVTDVEHDRKLFLFQFPPLVPFLAGQELISNMAGKATGPASVVKNDPDAAPTTESVEPDSGVSSKPGLPRTRMEGILTADEPLQLPAGRIGKLKIHKSGKVTLDWGGIDMEVRYGTEVDFLQDAVLVETPETTQDAGDRGLNTSVGKAYALGQVRKKMVVIPDWQQLYD